MWRQNERKIRRASPSGGQGAAAARRSKREGDGSPRRTKTARFLFLLTTEECGREGMGRVPAAPLGPNWFLWEHWAPLFQWPSTLVSQAHLHVSMMRNMTADSWTRRNTTKANYWLLGQFDHLLKLLLRISLSPKCRDQFSSLCQNPKICHFLSEHL